MKTILLHNPAKQDNVEAMADALVESMRYANSSVDYPDVSKAKPDDGVPAEWFYKAYVGTAPTSELTAILQYTQQRMIFDEIGETFLGIALTEMKHYDRLGDFINRIGGNVSRPAFSAAKVDITTKSAAEAVQINIRAEQDTIAEYEKLIQRIQANNPTPTVTSALAIQLINKIVVDERVHVCLLAELAQSLGEEDTTL
nr:MAG TPA: Mn catalase-like protein [Caudoviricetes sp.]